MNPPITTPLGLDDDRYMILDGTNRVIAFSQLNIPHIVIQVVPYSTPAVTLETWYHVISHADTNNFESAIASLPGLTTSESDHFHARAMLARRTILAYYILADGRIVTLEGSNLNLHRHNLLLQQIVDTYIQAGTLNRTNIDDIETLRQMHPDTTAVMVFPHYEPVEVLDLAQHGLRVPPGITRHIINGRALKLNYPLERLTSDQSLEEKNDELNAWMQSRFEHHGIRYYAESTYIFDE